MKYSKQPIDIPAQLTLLKQRGMMVNDEDVALKHLESISYFRLVSYWKAYEIDETTHQLVPDTQFEDIISLYKFEA